jgi:hypothetical protein
LFKPKEALPATEVVRERVRMHAPRRRRSFIAEKWL